MSDLISRSIYKSKLLKALDVLNKEYREAMLNNDNDLILAIQNQQSAYMIALRLLDNEPTAYDIGKVIEELEENARAEEQGLLLRLPCKVGDTVYAIGFNNNRPLVYESVVLSILITEKEIDFNVNVDEFEVNSQLKKSMFGKTVFLTQTEAEQKLKEMESD